MAKVFKPRNSAYQLADGNYRTPDGKRVTKTTPGAVKVDLGESPVWWGKYKLPNGKFKKVPLCSDKTASKQMLAKLQTDASLARVGIVDPFEESKKRPLVDHLEDFRRCLTAKGNCREHVGKTSARIKAVLGGCRFVFLADLDATRIADFLHQLRRDPPRPELPAGQEWFSKRELLAAVGRDGVNVARLLRRERLRAKGQGKARRYHRSTVEALQDRLLRGIGIATSNGYLAAMKTFCRWLVKDRRMGVDPLAHLPRLNAKTDVRHQRRALPEDDPRAILTAAVANSVGFVGLPGTDRAMIYAVAMGTGFRAGELASLTPHAFDLDAPKPTVCCRAAHTKNRREAIQPLPTDVAKALRRYLAGKPAQLPLWPGDWHEHAAEMLRLDLDAAGIPYRDEGGRVADFHALRHSYITLLERSGASPKMAQELARHSDIRLTMNVYTHAGLYDLAGAVENLPPLLPTASKEALAATGTDGAPGPKRCDFIRRIESC